MGCYFLKLAPRIVLGTERVLRYLGNMNEYDLLRRFP